MYAPEFATYPHARSAKTSLTTINAKPSLTTIETKDTTPPSSDFLGKFLNFAKRMLGHQVTKAIAGTAFWTGFGLSFTIVGAPIGAGILMAGVFLGAISCGITVEATFHTDENGNLRDNGLISVLATYVPPLILYFGDEVGVPNKQN